MLNPEQIKAINAKLGVKTTSSADPSREAFRESIKQTALTSRQNQARGGTDTELTDTFGNILPSAGKAISDVAHAVAGLSPIAPVKKVDGKGEELQVRVPPTLRALFDVGAGGVQKLIPGEQGNEKQFDAVVQFFVDRYGSLDAAKQTIINDPVGAALDIATVFSGGGGVVRQAGNVSKIAPIAKAGEVIQKAGEVIDPLTLGAKGVDVTRKLAGEVGKQALGFTTGAGPEAIKAAFRAEGPEFRQALRGETKPKDIVEVTRRALSDVEEARGTQYKERLQSIAETSGDSLDISKTVVNAKKETPAFDNEIARFGAKRADDGSIDWSRSAIDETDQRKLELLNEVYKEWGTQKGDRTALGLDLLYRRIRDTGMESKQGQAVITSLSRELKNDITKQVPEYATMKAEYQQVSEFIEELDTALAIGNGNRTETAITKLTQVLKQDKEYRQALVTQLEQATGAKITPQIAGAALRTWLPRGLVERMFGAGGVGAGILTPHLLLGIATGMTTLSPRLMGEFVRGLGVANNKIQDVVSAITAIKEKVPGIGEMTGTQFEQALFQAARVREEAEKRPVKK